MQEELRLFTDRNFVGDLESRGIVSMIVPMPGRHIDTSWTVLLPLLFPAG